MEGGRVRVRRDVNERGEANGRRRGDFFQSTKRASEARPRAIRRSRAFDNRCPSGSHDTSRCCWLTVGRSHRRSIDRPLFDTAPPPPTPRVASLVASRRHGELRAETRDGARRGYPSDAPRPPQSCVSSPRPAFVSPLVINIVDPPLFARAADAPAPERPPTAHPAAEDPETAKTIHSAIRWNKVKEVTAMITSKVRARRPSDANAPNQSSALAERFSEPSAEPLFFPATIRSNAASDPPTPLARHRPALSGARVRPRRLERELSDPHRRAERPPRDPQGSRREGRRRQRAKRRRADAPAHDRLLRHRGVRRVS